MPTGYTAKVQDGAMFEEFVWACARGFGALISMRDDPVNAPIPEQFNASNYYQDALAKDLTRLEDLEAMRGAQATDAAAAAYAVKLREHQEHVAKNQRTRENYEAMVAKVKGWKPPSPKHEGLRDFMLEQLRSSIEFDCYTIDPPKELDSEAWLADALKSVRWSIDYHGKEEHKEQERTVSRNEWLRLLRESVPVPTAVAP